MSLQLFDLSGRIALITGAGQGIGHRWGKVAELQGAAIFLASGIADFVNGQILYVDGGVLATL